MVADALSRINSVEKDDQHKESINFEKLAHAQEASDEMASYHTATTGLVLKDIDIDPSTLLCDISMGKPRPVLPTSWTHSIFNKIHSLSHTGIKPTQKAIAQRFVWNGMKRDILRWCKECADCQASKVHRHTRSPLVERQPASDRFRSLHVDLVGPLPESHGMTYLFTLIDRFTRWPEAISLPDAHASTCALALLHYWVARFGVPKDIVSDNGRQFTSTSGVS